MERGKYTFFQKKREVNVCGLRFNAYLCTRI